MAKLGFSGTEAIIAGTRIWQLGGNRFLATQDGPYGTSNSDISGQFLTGNLVPSGSPIGLAGSPTGEARPWVAGLSAGGFLMTWIGQTPNIFGTLSDAVFVQGFDAAGAAQGTPYQLAGPFTYWGPDPRIVILNDGSALVTWGTNGGVMAQHVSAGGQALSDPFALGTGGDISLTMDVVALAGGGFAAVWSDTRAQQAGPASLLHFRAFSADGVAQSAATVIAAFHTRTYAPDIVQLADGSLAVAYMNFSGGSSFDDPAMGDIFVQRVSASGVPIGSFITANYDTTGNQMQPAIAALPDGGFVVSWTDEGGTLGDANAAIHAQRFDAAGNYSGDVWRVNSITAGLQSLSQLSVGSDGSLTVGWFDQSGTGTGSLHAQSFTPVVEQHYEGTRGNNKFTATGAGDWVLNGGAGADKLTGSGGNDTIRGGAGNDTLAGGGGDDQFEVDLNGGFDSILGGDGFDRLLAMANNVTIGVSALSGIERISAMGHSNVTLSGDRGDNLIDLTGAELSGIAAILGGAGKDTIRGSQGDDTINGGAGIDLLSGGQGRDIFEGTQADLNGDTILDFGLGDRIRISDFNASGATYTLANGVLIVDPDGAGGRAATQIYLPSVAEGTGWLATEGADGSLTFAIMG